MKAWPAANPRITVHFTPMSGSWLNMVEVWFGIIERQAIHRRLEPPQTPFVWTKPADQILAAINRKRKHNTGTYVDAPSPYDTLANCSHVRCRRTTR